MNNVINYNELRELAVKAGKAIPRLACIKIQDGKAYFTNTRYLVIMEGYKNTDDCVMNMDNYKKSELDYPNLDAIINQDFNSAEFEKAILDDKVVYKVNNCCVDNEIITQLKKLIAIENYTVDVNNFKINKNGHVAKLELPDGSAIIIALKFYRNK